MATDTNEKSTTKAPISEEFQLQVMDLLKGASEQELDFISSATSKCRMDMMNDKNGSPEPTIDDYDAAKEEEE